jgi:hypothetical protein
MTTIEQQVIALSREWAQARREWLSLGQAPILPKSDPRYGDYRAAEARYDTASQKLVVVMEKLETK